MKKANKKLLTLLMAATFVSAGAGAFIAYNGVNEQPAITASAEDTVDCSATAAIDGGFAKTGDYTEAAMYRIWMKGDLAKSWTKGCLNDGRPELLNYITINGKTVAQYREEYAALLASGETSPITWTGMPDNGPAYPHTMQPNIREDVIAGRAIYAPIFVMANYHGEANGNALDIYIPVSYLDPADVKEVSVKAGFTIDNYTFSKDATFRKTSIGEYAKQEQREIIPTSVTSIDGSYGTSDQFLSFYLSENDYNGLNTSNYKDSVGNAKYLNTFNFYDYIEIDGVPYGQLWNGDHPGEQFFNVWSRFNSFSTRWPSALKNAGTTDAAKKITIKKGCQFPSATNPTGVAYEVQADTTFVRQADGSFVDEAKLIKADEITISEAAIAGEASELYQIDITCAKWNFPSNKDAYDYNYFGAEYANMRKNILINGVSLWDINTTVDDSAYVYSTSPFTLTNTSGEYQIFQNPTLLYGEKGGNTLRIWIHKQYIQDTNANEIVVTIVNGYKHYDQDTATVETVSASVWKKPMNVSINGVAQQGLVYGDKVAKPADPADYEENGYKYTFDNWYVVGTDTVYDFDAALTGDVAIEARFFSEAIEYTITFVVDGETVSTDTYTVEDKEITVPEVPAKEGYVGAWEAYELTTGNITVNAVYTLEYAQVSIPEANAAEDGTKVEVSGTVCAINTAWSEQHGNITVTIVDAEGNELYVYRMKTNVAVGDIITLKGVVGSFNGSKQIAAGSTAVITGHDTSYDYVEMSIVDALAAEDNTNVIVTGTVVKIGTAYSSSYNNISVYIADDNGVQLYLYRLTGNVEVGQIIKVKGAMATYKGARQVTGGTYEAVGTHECSKFTDATCTEAALCVVCGAANGEALGHNETSVVTNPTCTEAGYTTYTCTVCGETRTADETAAAGHSEGDWIVDVEPQIGVVGSQHKECTVCGETVATEEIPALEEPDYVEATINEGENTISIPAGQYAVSNVYMMGDYTMSWTGDVSVTLNGAPVANGDVVTFQNPRLGMNEVVITPNGAEGCDVVITLAAYVEPAIELALGDNAINVTVENNFCEGVNVQFTAPEAGKYVLKAADGEENADVYAVFGEYNTEWVELPYEFEVEAGQVVTFNVCTTAIMTLTEDEINLVLAKVEAEVPPTSEEPEVPGESEEPEVPGESEEPEVPGESEEPEVPATSEKPADSESKKKGGCGSSVALGMVGALTAAGAALVIKKRKED